MIVPISHLLFVAFDITFVAFSMCTDLSIVLGLSVDQKLITLTGQSHCTSRMKTMHRLLTDDEELSVTGKVRQSKLDRLCDGAAHEVNKGSQQKRERNYRSLYREYTQARMHTNTVIDTHNRMQARAE